MTTKAVRSTFYLEPGLHHALCRKAATAHRSISEIVNDAVRALLRKDEEGSPRYPVARKKIP